MVCLVVPLAGTILFGFRDHQIFLGFFAAAINIIAAAVITIFTWFMVPPSALIGMWLLLAGVLWGEARQTLRRRLLSAGPWTVVISMIVSLALLFLPSYGDYIGSLVNLGLAIWLVRSSRSPVTSQPNEAAVASRLTHRAAQQRMFRAPGSTSTSSSRT